MEERDYKTITEVARELKLTTFTLKRWQRAGLIKKEKEYDKRYKRDIRKYYQKDIDKLKWLKKMSGSYQTNDFYLKLLLEYIETGKIDPERLKWPLKSK